MRMWVYVVRRVLLLFPVIIGVMTITFLILSALPIQTHLVAEFGASKIPYTPMVPCSDLGQPGDGQCSNPTYFQLVHQLGLDQPIYVQWLEYMKNSLTLNWGTVNYHSNAANYFSLTTSVPVTTVLGWYLPYTLELAALSLIIILAIAIPLGNYSAVYRNRPIDQAARVMSFSGFALPGFLLATLVLFAAVILSGGATATCSSQSTHYFDWYGSWPQFPQCTNQPTWIGSYLQTSPTGFPTVDAILHGNWFLAGDSVRRMVLPALVIAYGSVAAILRFVRNSMLEVLNLDFIRTARAKGVAEAQVVSRHAGRNSLNVTVTVLGLTFAGFIGGFPIIEDVFDLHGVGLLLAKSIQPTQDFGLIFGTTLLFTIIVVVANILVDVLYAYLDPRVRLG